MQDIKNKGQWLSDLMQGTMQDDAIVKGFIKHYVLNNRTMCNLHRDIVFYIGCKEASSSKAVELLKRALSKFVDSEETRTLSEIQLIVDAVRVGAQVQKEYYDSETDDDPYVLKACW